MDMIFVLKLESAGLNL